MVILVKPFVRRASQKGHRNAFAGKKPFKDVCFAYATFISHNHVFLEPKRTILKTQRVVDVLGMWWTTFGVAITIKM